MSKADPRIQIARNLTSRDRAAFAESPGRRPDRSAASYVTDLAELKKAILLCPSCTIKFNRQKYGYDTKVGLPLVEGKCDGCRDYSAASRLFLHEATAHKVWRTE